MLANGRACAVQTPAVRRRGMMRFSKQGRWCSMTQERSSSRSTLDREGLEFHRAICGPVEQAEMVKVARDLLAGSALDWADYQRWRERGAYQRGLFASPHRDRIMFDFLGVSPRLDMLVLEVLVRTDALQRIRAEVVGYIRLWHAQLRLAKVGARNLRIHRDVEREFVVTILLDDVRTLVGALRYLPSWHHWHRRLTPPRGVSPFLIRGLGSSATGVRGDAYLFNGRLCHGREAPCLADQLALLVSLIPASSARATDRPVPKGICSLLDSAS